MLTATKVALWIGIATPVLGGTGYVAKLAGDTLWVPKETFPTEVQDVADPRYVSNEAWQMEKLYDLKDEAFEWELQEKYEGELSPREQEQLDRLRQRIDRLEMELME